MTRVKILALLAAMVLLFTLTATVSAQRVPPHVFVGDASIDDVAVAEGTSITAWVGGVEVVSATTTGTGGDYVITVDQGDSSFAGETISFQIAGLDAAQTATWTQGGADLLTLSASAAETPIPEATAVPEATEVPEVVTEPGEQGPRGMAGATGIAGAEGPEGPEGSKGNAGATGSKGEAGAAGAQGAAGPAGGQGTTGNAGGQGQPGSAGLQGDDGSNVLGVIALILAIIGIVGAGGAFLLSRRS